jgi:hypothetical protein
MGSLPPALSREVGGRVIDAIRQTKPGSAGGGPGRVYNEIVAAGEKARAA